MLLGLTCLVFSAVNGVAMAPVTRANLCPVADSEPILTVDALTRMTNFWTAFVKEPDSIKTIGRKANQKELTLSFMGQPITWPSVVNMVAMASKYPAVARDLQHAGLTPLEWERYRHTLLMASLMQQIVKAVAAQTEVPESDVTNRLATEGGETVLAKNVAFLLTHPKEFDTLKASGMWLPQIPTQLLQQAMQQTVTGGDANDLDP